MCLRVRSSLETPRESSRATSEPPATVFALREAIQTGGMRMSIRATIISEIQRIGESEKKKVRPLTDDLVLLESGLDSLAIAILVARLEETLGFDPFTESDDIYYPVTLGDFIRFYENAAESRDDNSRQAG
jgi:acyl carrier protein